MNTWSRRLLARTESAKRLARDRREFLPAALEVQETPPSRAGRLIVWAIMLLFVIAIVWAVVGRVDVVAVAHGRIISSGRAKVIQPMRIGRVSAIHVRGGNRVGQGEALITLDGTVTGAELERLETSLTLLRLERARERAFVAALTRPDDSAAEAPSIRPYLDDAAWSAHRFRFHSRLLRQQLRAVRAERASLANRIDSRRAERRMGKVAVAKLERTLPIVAERADALHKLYRQNLAARARYLEFEQARIEQQARLRAERVRLSKLKADIRELVNQRERQLADHLSRSLERQAQLTREIERLAQELVKAREAHRQHVLVAPIAGTVQELRIHTIGGVVKPAQPLMRIVPEQPRLIAEVWVLNKDIGFVHEGQSAEVKINTFNFTKYGAIDGTLAYLSDAAVPHEKLGLRYLAHIRLAKSHIAVSGKPVRLSPGMTLTAEVTTGERRLIEFFLSPLLRYAQESLRER